MIIHITSEPNVAEFLHAACKTNTAVDFLHLRDMNNAHYTLDIAVFTELQSSKSSKLQFNFFRLVKSNDN